MHNIVVIWLDRIKYKERKQYQELYVQFTEIKDKDIKTINT